MSTITTDIDLVASLLRAGEIAAIPTETVYGLAANAEDDEAIHKIYALKNRPLNHPLIMHVAQDCDLARFVDWQPDYVQTLIDHFWPGPLTLVLPCRREQVSALVNGGQLSVALRCPAHPLAQALLKQVGKPLVAPSANPFSKLSPTTAEHVQRSFPDSELVILDGGRCEVGIESTILAAVDNRGYKILRQGGIDAALLEAVLPDHALNEPSHIRSSGNLKNHYQPEKPFYCFTSESAMQQFCQTQQNVYVISFTKNRDFDTHSGYQMPDHPKAAAFEFYYQLRQADESSAEVIIMELPPNTPAWQGIIERAEKAATKIY